MSSRIDAHQHFWRYSAEAYPWIPKDSALARDWLPSDLARLQEPLGFDGSIAVQARQSIAESDWLLDLADKDPRVRGVVGWVDLQSATVDEDLERLSRHPRFVGVRHVVQDEPDDNFLLGPAFVRGVSRLRAHRLSYDLLVFPRQLPAAIQLVRQFPDQAFVLDHVAKPSIRTGNLEPWARDIRELALESNVWCKVSGLVTEADHASWTVDDFERYFDVVLEAFGPGRLMFGSDWPVCLLAASYARVLEVAEVFASRLDPGMRASFFGGNAGHFYFPARRAG